MGLYFIYTIYLTTFVLGITFLFLFLRTIKRNPEYKLFYRIIYFMALYLSVVLFLFTFINDGSLNINFYKRFAILEVISFSTIYYLLLFIYRKRIKADVLYNTTTLFLYLILWIFILGSVISSGLVP